MDIKELYISIRKVTSANHFWIVLGVVGIWVIVLQNFGVFSSNDEGCQSVFVEGGRIDVDEVNEINSTVDVNIESINGYRNAFYGPSQNGSYDAIHVYTGR